MGEPIIATTITTLGAALGLVKRLADVAKKVNDAEISGLLADLNLELANANNQLAAVISENASLKTEVEGLDRRKLQLDKLEVKGEHHYEKDKEGGIPHCTPCYYDGFPIPLALQKGPHRQLYKYQCPKCKATFSQ